MDTELKDFELIDKAGFAPEIKFVAQTTVAALHCLKALSSERGIPMDQITAEHIIKEFSQCDGKLREHQKWLADIRAQSP